MEMERKDVIAYTCILQLPKHMNIEHSEAIMQKGNRLKGKWEHNKSKIKKLLQ